MEKSRKKLWFVIGTVVVLVLAIGITAVFAQEGDDVETPDEAAPEEETASPLPFFARHFRFADGAHGLGMRGFGDALEGITPRSELLADALGIELEELIEAQQSAYAAWLAEMVANGYMDQEQADLMLAYQALKGNLDRHAIMAEVLGLTEAELDNAREDGKNLSDLLDEQDLTVEEFTAALDEAYQDAVQALVPDVLTQEQADQILESGVGFHDFGGGRRSFGNGMLDPGGARPGFRGHHGSHGLGPAMQGFGGAMPGLPGSSSSS